MELYASGFNAHGQLLPSSSPQDLRSFQKIASGTTIHVRCTKWSAIVLEIDGVLELRGSQCRNEHVGQGLNTRADDGGNEESLLGDYPERIYKDTVAVLRGLPPARIKTIVGDDDSGLLCALTMEGELWVVDEANQVQQETSEVMSATDGSIALSLSWVRHDLDFGAFEAGVGFSAMEEWERGELVIDQIALASNDRVCISTRARKTTFPAHFLRNQPMRTFSPAFAKKTTTGPTTAHSSTLSSSPSTLLTFPSLSSLLSSSPTIISTATLPVSPTSLVGSSATFQALCDSVPYTWGDARYAHLGRNPSQDSPADKPSPVVIPPMDGDNLEPHAQKIAAAGWLTAFLTRGDCFIWGGRLGEKERRIGARDGNEEEELQRCVEVEGGAVDVVDVAVGSGWVMVLTKTGKVWGWGNGTWGQLGMKGDKTGWVQGWVELGGWEGNGKEVVGVECGVWNSFVLVKTNV